MSTTACANCGTLVYGEGPWLTLSKVAALGAAYLFLGALMVAATVSYTFLML